MIKIKDLALRRDIYFKICLEGIPEVDKVIFIFYLAYNEY